MRTKTITPHEGGGEVRRAVCATPPRRGRGLDLLLGALLLAVAWTSGGSAQAQGVEREPSGAASHEQDLPSGGAAARGFSPLQEIGWSRSLGGGFEYRLRLAPGGVESLSRSGEVRLAPLNPTEAWLLSEMRRRFPAVESCQVVASARAVCSADSVALRSERDLVLVGPKEVLEEARAHLARLRAAWTGQLFWKMRLIVLDEALEDPFTPQVRVRVLSPAEHKALLEGKGESVSAPSLLTLAGQSASVSTMKNTSYVKDFSLELTDGGITADPVLDNLEEGLRLEVVGIPRAGGRSLLVKGTYETSAAARPPRRWRVEIPGEARHLTLELPEVTRMKLDLAAEGPLGVPFVFEGLPWLWPAEGGRGAPELRRALLVCEVSRVGGDAAARKERASGRVLGVDSSRRLAFLEVTQPGGLEAGRVVVFEHPRKEGEGVEACGKGRILRVAGEKRAIAVVAILEGAPRAGDRAR